MISYIKGELTEVFEDMIVIENNNIGYNIRVPACVIDEMPHTGEFVKVYTYMYVREDAINLFGFLSHDEVEIFKLLINVSGIGPKGALAILSAMTVDELRFAILSDDVKVIKSAPGIGAKTAQRLIIELKDKLNLEDTLERAVNSTEKKKAGSGNVMLARNDAVEALVALGYSNSEALRAVKLVDNADEKDSDMILKEALKKLV